MTQAAVERSAPADAAWLLARWWSRPLPDEVAAWAGLWGDARAVAAELGVESDGVDRLEAATLHASAAELADEYERLLVGPGRAPCPPYESLWRAEQQRLEQGRVMGAPTSEVIDLYGTLGLAVRSAAHELPDHVAIEWEALAYALVRHEPEPAAVAQALLEDHLAVWLPPFCAAVEAEAGSGFYRELAQLTREWVAALQSGAAAP